MESTARDTAGTRELVYEVFIVYDPTALDYPGRWTCRRWIATPTYPQLTPTEPLFANCDHLDAVRAKIRAHNPALQRFGRKPGYDTCVKEVWSVPAQGRPT